MFWKQKYKKNIAFFQEKVNGFQLIDKIFLGLKL